MIILAKERKGCELWIKVVGKVYGEERSFPRLLTRTRAIWSNVFDKGLMMYAVLRSNLGQSRGLLYTNNWSVRRSQMSRNTL